MSASNAQLGHAVRRLRQARRHSLEELAGAAHMHPTYLSAIERGLRNPTWSKLCDLSQALQITVAQLAHAAEAERYGAIYLPSTPGDHAAARPAIIASTVGNQCRGEP
ncbi:MAG TPA: helix-turn-helix transcriptional regulator [Solirubrobacteraceae bacterium]|jgi:transcriptional regulator with XRE-family HTH domain|nr:helix-turn-helix transcriptional regulator [Solirubrobacteraceae bacterium]